MSKARQLADLGNQVDDGAITGSNMVVNGGMTVAQRGTSATLTGTGAEYVALDRWELYRNASFAPNITVSQSTDAPSGFLNSMKVDVDATDTPTGGENFGFRTKIEGVDTGRFNRGTASAENMTLSFYVKSNKTGTYSIQLFDMGGTIYSKLVAYTIDAVDTWERKEIILQANTNSNSPTLSNSEGLRVAFDLGSGPDDVVPVFDWSSTYGGATRAATGQVNLLDSTSNYWQITGVCLNVGDSAIDFPHENYGETLAKCQRYFESIETSYKNSSSGYFTNHGNGAWVGPQFNFKVTKRATPSIISDLATFSWRRASFRNSSATTIGTGASTTQGITTDSFVVSIAESGISNGTTALLFSNAGYFYTADAEL
jgi:hypothetical protein